MDPNSPYFLASSDVPGVNVGGVEFNGANYWERAVGMLTAFRAKGKEGVLLGFVTEPEGSEEGKVDWIRVNSMMISWIMALLEPTLHSIVGRASKVKDSWDEIQERFGSPDSIRENELKTAIPECKQAGSSVTAYYGRLKELWDEYYDYRTTNWCLCGKCKCAEGGKLEKAAEKDKVHEFLMGLDSSLYGGVRTNILATDPLPSLSKVFNIIIKEERHKT